MIFSIPGKRRLARHQITRIQEKCLMVVRGSVVGIWKSHRMFNIHSIREKEHEFGSHSYMVWKSKSAFHFWTKPEEVT